MPNNPTISDCSVFVNIWVDTSAVVLGGTQGVYCVDNRGYQNPSSQNEGTASLQTQCTTGAKTCWQAFVMNPSSGDTVQLTGIGNSEAWGNSGQPEQAPSSSGVNFPPAYTGIVQTAGSNSYTVTFNVKLSGGSFIPVTATLGISAS
jgi:hypothetical protein